jgi:DNA-binding GntR family transcriptional regulator
MERIEPEPRVLIDDTVARLEELILRGEILPGARLPEQALAELLGVSRGPLREAIRTLEGRRIVERTPHAGVRVVQLTLQDVEQLLVTREALEGMAARQAAENMTVAEIRQLREVASRLEKLQEEGPGAVFARGADNDFHRLIALGGRNQWIVRLLCEDLYSLLRLYRMHAAYHPPAKRRPTHREHQEIIDCIHARDADAAEVAMRRHIQNGRTRLLEQIAGARIANTR